MGPTMRFSASTLALVLSLVLTPCAVRADWIPNGNPIGVTDYPVHGRSPAKATGDGSGGAFVAWEGPGYGPLLLSHLAADGRTAEGWSPAGLRLRRGRFETRAERPIESRPFARWEAMTSTRVTGVPHGPRWWTAMHARSRCASTARAAPGPPSSATCVG